MKGEARLGIQDEITDKILEYRDNQFIPNIKLSFLESRRRKLDYGEWFEYYVLFRVTRLEDSARYLSNAFSGLSKIMDYLKQIESIDSLGIEDIELGESGSYYILFYILKNGK